MFYSPGIGPLDRIIARFDGCRLLTGSDNWTRGADEQNEENLPDTGDPAVLAAFAGLWARLA